MGILTDDMKRVVRDQRLGFIATVCPDGTPNLSPKGSATIWDDDHLMFGHMRSPVTMANLRQNPAMEINVVDVFVRKGYRFKGRAEILTDGPRYDEIMTVFKEMGLDTMIHEIVLMRVERAEPLISPAYDRGVCEDDVGREWAERWNALHPVD
ncbi:MAG: pyridoxamine 5'-phosphate oxidase family protein [Candidatus Tectomicrobia bacterium]|nr:pyridoxamine 5'-phosphate oxidase family protein [Candidatus Tectomicrobia bacterium]